jgi:hypothetical protein
LKSAAIGVSVHSGWGAVVTVTGQAGAEEVLDRRRLVIIDSKVTGAAQPYHYVQAKEIHAAEAHLYRCAAESRRLAVEALTRVASELRDRGFVLVASALLLSSGRPLPALTDILASHPLIHTAEGEFFRQSFSSAFEHLKIPLTRIRARDLDDYALKAFGKAATEVHNRIDGMGRTLGAPWTKDEKTAALAAAIVLAGTESKRHAYGPQTNEHQTR